MKTDGDWQTDLKSSTIIMSSPRPIHKVTSVVMNNSISDEGQRDAMLAASVTL